MTRPLALSTRSSSTGEEMLLSFFAESIPALRSVRNLVFANGGISSIGKLSIRTLALSWSGHWTEPTFGPANGIPRTICSIAPWKSLPVAALAAALGAASAEDAAATVVFAAGEDAAATLLC